MSLFAPVVDRQQLVAEVATARTAGQPIILANGCFDLFHAGHVRYLSGAKDLGGYLVVAINSDRQVQRLKGVNRPYIKAEERAEIVSGFRFVDLVTIFDEPNVEAIIAAIRPDFHAKGTDYTTDSVPERETVLKYGGKVAIVGDPKDHSSTELIAAVSNADR
jgi:rfaE bifunctional protein nucleotidyltransferase chain/domain